jgi:hypothetical protein
MAFDTLTRAAAVMGLAATAIGLAAARLPARSPAVDSPDQITWTFDRLDNIGGVPTKVEGRPKVVDSPVGRAVEFNGVDDALFIERHPLAGAQTFTFEAIFRPDGGTDFAQRWFHLAERDVKTGLLAPEGYPQNPDTNSRFVFELRTKDGQWLAGRVRHGRRVPVAAAVREQETPGGSVVPRRANLRRQDAPELRERRTAGRASAEPVQADGPGGRIGGHEDQ